MSSFFSNSHTVATRASAHFCGIFTAAPASHNSAPLVSPIHTIGSTNTDRVSKLYTGLTPLSLFSSVHLTNSLDQTRFAQMSSCGKMTPHYNSEEERKGRGQVWGKNPHIGFWTCDPGRTARTMSRLIATVDNNKKGQFTLLIAYCPCVKQLGYYTIL